MITSFEVGAVFRIINEASPALTKILRQVRELTASLDKAKISLAEVGKIGGLNTAAGETERLAAAWKNVAVSAREARTAMAGASRMATGGGARAALGNRIGIGSGGLGGVHVGGPPIPIPGGGHARVGSGAAMAGAAAFGWGLDQAMKQEDYVWRMEDIAGLDHDEATHKKFRRLLQNFQIKSGYGIDEAGKAALASLRQFQGVPGGGVDTLDEILSAGAVEARRKGASLEESVESGIGLAHQFRAWSPAAIRDLMRTFAALSTADPRSLTSMKRAAGYSVPALAQIGVDESSVLLAGTALASAGIDSTKSGTWIREAVVRALGTGDREALTKLHLLDENGKPTWFTGGRPDMFKLFSMSSDALQGMSPEDRALYGRKAFGAQGFGGISVLSDPLVNQRMHQIDALRKSPLYRERYENFGKDYEAGSPLQNFRSAVQIFNVTMSDLGMTVLPAVNKGLGDFKAILDGIRAVLPAGGGATIGARMAEGVGAGALYGALGGPGGVAVGAAAGGMLGAALGYMQEHGGLSIDKGGSYTSPGRTGKPAQPIVVKQPPVTLNLNIDGRTLARALSEAGSPFEGLPTQAPAADGLTQSRPGGDNYNSN